MIRAGAGISGARGSREAAEQAVHRQAERFSHQVVKRHVDSAHYSDAQTLAVPVNTRLIHHFPSPIDLRGLVVGENPFEVLDHSDYRIVAELTMSDLTQSIFTVFSRYANQSNVHVANHTAAVNIIDMGRTALTKKESFYFRDSWHCFKISAHWEPIPVG